MSVALEKCQACLQLPDHELQHYYAQVSKDHASATEMIKEYEGEAPLIAGFKVKRLETMDVAAFERMRFVKQQASASHTFGQKSHPFAFSP